MEWDKINWKIISGEKIYKCFRCKKKTYCWDHLKGNLSQYEWDSYEAEYYYACNQCNDAR